MMLCGAVSMRFAGLHFVSLANFSFQCDGHFELFPRNMAHIRSNLIEAFMTLNQKVKSDRETLTFVEVSLLQFHSDHLASLILCRISQIDPLK